MCTAINQPMAWTHQRIKYTSNDCINLKALWKMLILDSNPENEDIKNENVSSSFFSLRLIFLDIFKFKPLIE